MLHPAYTQGRLAISRFKEGGRVRGHEERGEFSLYENRFEVIRADTPALLDRVYQLRYQVYCVENQFEDPVENLGGREIDADDDHAAHVLLTHRESGDAA